MGLAPMIVDQSSSSMNLGSGEEEREQEDSDGQWTPSLRRA